MSNQTAAPTPPEHTAAPTPSPPSAPEAQDKAGFVKLYAPKDAGPGVSIGGEQYNVRKDGTVLIPENCMAQLLPHGYTLGPAAKK